ncbi:hypothetical protein FA13DRAFT_1733395 [Coprinellus micaceus]|uniref:Cep57 centrosome microtubule-binding domain-containing protein n=1 Tax=Coprinellus micaceus TaxID=71717 RepID=A0A4Y7T984_COPMI|nr:hypothetical protein FA13DRAFT_1733395 [Coprinellus micaceus]
MRRHTKGPTFDLSIHRDELEHDRRQLENRLKSNASIPAPPPASDDDEDYYHYHQNSSVEHPRHVSGDMHQPDFPSFAHRSREHMREEDSHMHMGWSYRTADEDEGVNPYGGETMSTAAHHASAITLNAGLGGGRGARRDISMSGAEYDPDRPLNQIMAGVGRMSMFDEQSKSKNTATNNLTFEPLVVDSTAELDRILQSGYAPQNQSVHPTPPTSHASSSSRTDSEPASPPRPKLSDHLRTLAFSPKRPRTVPMSPGHNAQTSPLAKRSTLSRSSSMDIATPRPARRAPIHNPTPHPELRVQPATPSTNTTTSSTSKFTRMARGITKEIAESQADANRPRRASVDKQESAAAPGKHNTVPSRRNIARADQSKSRLVLPDVTGLTMAVESPARLSKDYHSYKGVGSREAEARLVQTLGQVQSKLQQLNEENGISRRRVRELEMELEDCRRDVARERTRVLEKESAIIEQQKELHGIASRAKGKAKQTEEDAEDILNRYQNAVAEKKALEALIGRLRSHLTRLTNELASHTELLQELRELRETDSRTLREKGNEITRLKDEVERLAGEVEVLQGLVEEGLRERRAGKEASMQREAEADTGMSHDLDESEEEAQETMQVHPKRRGMNAWVSDDSDEEGGDDDDSTYEPSLSSRLNSGVAEKTIRTDHATLGTSVTRTPQRVQFIDQQELRRIEREVEERRIERMESRDLDPSFYERDRPSAPLPPSPSPSPQPERARQMLQSKPPAQKQQTKQSNGEAQKRPERRSSPPPATATEAPFPQIRGDRLEKLFFSAPEHNPKTCTVCFRRNADGGEHHHHHHQPQPSWSMPHARARQSAEDEGDGNDDPYHRTERRGSGVGLGPGGDERSRHLEGVPSDASYFRRVGSRAGLPPQTVAMRVIRELEDDFTHYKSVYVELADQYKEMDSVSDVPRRNMLAKHLKEVVDILEQKGDQIASLSDLLAFKDKLPSGSRK